MVAPAEKLADFGERDLRLLANQIHRYLARQDDMFIALLAAHLLKGEMIIRGYHLGNAPAIQERWLGIML